MGRADRRRDGSLPKPIHHGSRFWKRSRSYNKDFYRMNGGSNCARENLSYHFSRPPCKGDCALDYGQILQPGHLQPYADC